jgi:hypothetical protein
MDNFQIILNIIAGVLIMPITQWLKAKLPEGFPISSVAISYGMAVLATWGLARAFNPTMAWAEIITIAFALVGTVAQTAHAIYKQFIKE